MLPIAQLPAPQCGAIAVHWYLNLHLRALVAVLCGCMVVAGVEDIDRLDDIVHLEVLDDHA